MAFAVATLAAVSWHEYRELIDLRAQVSDGELAMLKKQLADARKAIKSLEDRMAAMRGRRGGGGLAGDDANGDNAAGGGGRGRAGGRFGFLGQMANNPEF